MGASNDSTSIVKGSRLLHIVVDLLAFLPQPVHGVIVNIERLKKEEDKELGSEDNNGKVNYYMKQSGTLDNACGIIACLHTALNKLDVINLTADSILDKFYLA